MMRKNCVEWRDIKGYVGWYQVSRCGQVRGLDRIVGNKMRYPVKGRIMTPRMGRGGYMDVQLQMNGKCKRMTIHRLVALAFIPNPDNKEMVNHIDGDKKNNLAQNLEWNSRSENMQHAVSNGLIDAARPKKIPLLIIKDEEERLCKTITEAAKIIGRSSQAVRFALYRDRDCNGWVLSYLMDKV